MQNLIFAQNTQKNTQKETENLINCLKEYSKQCFFISHGKSSLNSLISQWDLGFQIVCQNLNFSSNFF